MATLATFVFRIPFDISVRPEGYVDVTVEGTRYSNYFKVDSCRIHYVPDPTYQEHDEETFPYSCTLTFGGGYTLTWTGLNSEPKDQSWQKLRTEGWMDTAQFTYGTVTHCLLNTVALGGPDSELQTYTVQ